MLDAGPGAEAADDDDERHGAVGPAAVDEAGPPALLLRVPLGHDVDAAGVHHPGADPAEHGVAEVGHPDRVGLGEYPVADDPADDAADDHRPPDVEDAAVAQVPGEDLDEGLEDDEEGERPERPARGPSGAPRPVRDPAAPQVYSSSPARHMASQAAMIGTQRPWPRRSRGVSPTRKTRPVVLVTTSKLACPVVAPMGRTDTSHRRRCGLDFRPGGRRGGCSDAAVALPGCPCHGMPVSADSRVTECQVLRNESAAAEVGIDLGWLSSGLHPGVQAG